ncbi:unnamed protein product [Microthlaspi erraticum]|uniref:F-box domain-containing protein n=1 Tax=Microthlaspi erraticum TaxID=1685480 RepID=A0A6D2KTA7_9BRAS|nr:unnamed protein product [Microthlaspi erraticum]
MSLSPTPNWYQRIVLLIKKTMKKLKKPSPQQSEMISSTDMISSLPDDLLISCFAILSRLYYPSLSLSSKRFQSLIASPELYETRSRLGLTESCLYVCLQFPPDSNTRWYTLSWKPDHTGNNKEEEEESSGRLLVPVSIQNSAPSEWSTLVAVGPYIYAISGSIEEAPFSNVPFLDCRTRTWLEAPRLRVAHHTNSEYVGKMYLPGKCENPESLNGIEVFDTETQTWKPVPPERREFKDETMEGKIIVENVNETPGENGLVYIPKAKAIEYIGSYTCSERDCDCIIANIGYFYASDTGEIEWSANTDAGFFSGIVQGIAIEGLPEFPGDVLLAEHGGNLVALWEEFAGEDEKNIWCAEVSLDRRSNGQIWGHVKWCHAVLTVPEAYELVYALSAIV